MSPAEFAQKYGASQADADKVTRSLEAYGLKVDKVSLATRSMSNWTDQSGRSCL